MRYALLSWTNLMRKKIRTLLTLLSIITAFLLYGLLSAVNNAFTGGVDLAGADRLLVMNRASFLQPLPLAYLNRITAVEGVRQVSHVTWIEGYYREPKNYVMAMAVDADTYLPLYRELITARTEEENWLNNLTGAMVGAALAERFRWKVGDRITLRTGISQGGSGEDSREFTIDAIYNSPSGIDTGALLMHYQYFNEGRQFERDTVWSYVVAIETPDEAGIVAKRIDQLFENSPAETRTWTEKAILQTMAAQFGNIGAIVLAISSTVFFTMLLVTGSAISEAVNERRAELATFKAIGFTHVQVSLLILAESMFLVGLGGSIGLALAYTINSGLSTVLQQYLPMYAMRPSDLMIGIGMIVLFGCVTGFLPALGGFRLPIAQTLRAE